jgi:endonuclease/exonuclease/phosphatase family metal-dependent hydrolase
MFKMFLISLLFVSTFVSCSKQDSSKEYTIVIYNVENLFDADGIAVFNDYKPDTYTPRHVFTKIDNMAKLMARYNDGVGPDIMILSEMESDFTQPEGGNAYSIESFLSQYSETTLDDMLGANFNATIADLPSELLLLKGLYDRGLTGYDISVAYDPLVDGRPTHVQKNVILSRLPIDHAKTKSHTIPDARPILETWVDINGHPLVLFANHWKSGASNADIEKTRVENAWVLKSRLDELRAENPRVDFILGGDFNSDYNQSHRYDYMELTGINDVLYSSGNEEAVAMGHPEKVYNLWHEIPVDERGSDVFRGYWGTLMQIMISPGLYDYSGVQYVDNSFERGVFVNKNVYATSITPRRWNAFSHGLGYSDHLPISMKITFTNESDTSKIIELVNPGRTDNDIWTPIAITSKLPAEGDYYDVSTISGSIRSDDYFDELFLVNALVNNRFQVSVNDELYDMYSPEFNVREYFADKIDTEVSFYGRLGMFRGNWQFVIESESFVLSN